MELILLVFYDHLIGKISKIIPLIIYFQKEYLDLHEDFTFLLLIKKVL
jgi:hypothetical protein